MRKHPLQIWREEQALSRDAFAKRIGVTGECIRLWETQKRTPGHQHMRKLQRETGGRLRADHFYGMAS